MQTGEADIVELLRQQAITRSSIERILAEDKSRRQGDNPEGRTDLYSWPTPEQTLEGKSAATIEALRAEIAERDALLREAGDALQTIERADVGLQALDESYCEKGQQTPWMERAKYFLRQVERRREIARTTLANLDTIIAKQESSHGKG